MKEYCFIKKIGQGGSASVYLARSIADDRLCVIKKVFRKEEDLMWAAQKEASILQRLQMDCFPEIYDFYKDRDAICIVMEYLPGISLYDWCKGRRKKGEEIIWLMESLCRSVSLLHAQLILHMDISPGNILISESGKVWLIDFESAVCEQAAASPVYRGTKKFAAPEMYQKNAVVDVRTDIYEVGKIGLYLYDHIVDKKDWKDLKRIFQKASAKEKEKRYQSMKDCLQEIQNAKSMVYFQQISKKGHFFFL